MRDSMRLPARPGSLAVCRMVFRQPRQTREDLLSHLIQRPPTEQLGKALDRLRINLTPRP